MSAAALLLEDLVSPAAVSATAWQADFANASEGPERLAAALCAGIHGSADAIATLTSWLGDDDASATAWALGQLDSEAAVCAVVDGGNLDQRDNGYQALAYLAARDAASAQLADWCAQRVASEIEFAKAGKTCLGEQACRVLAILGDQRTDELTQAVIEADSYCDRFELQRIRKAVRDGERDRDAIAELTEAWSEIFADELGDDSAATEAEDATLPEAEEPEAASPAPEDAPAPPEKPAAEDLPPEDPDAQAMPATSVDWEDFAASPEMEALDEQAGQMVGQFGPMLDQLSAQAIQKPLIDLEENEFAALYLQVLPQAIPPQYMQILVAPQTLNAFKALSAYCERVHGTSAIADGLKIVREAIQQQLRAAGSLHGSDYDEDEG